MRVYGEFFKPGGSVLRDDWKLVSILDMLVVAKVLCCAARLVHAICGHRRPAELESDDCKKDVHKAPDHGRNIAWAYNGLPASPRDNTTYRPEQEPS